MRLLAGYLICYNGLIRRRLNCEVIGQLGLAGDSNRRRLARTLIKAALPSRACADGRIMVTAAVQRSDEAFLTMNTYQIFWENRLATMASY